MDIFETLKNKKLRVERVKSDMIDADNLNEDEKIEEEKIKEKEIEKKEEKINSDDNINKNIEEEISLLIKEVNEYSANEIKNLLKMWGIEITVLNNEFFLKEGDNLKKISEIEMKKIYLDKIFKETYPNKNINDFLDIKEALKENLFNYIEQKQRKLKKFKLEKNKVKYPKMLLNKNNENIKISDILDNIINNCLFENYEPLLKIKPFLEKKENILKLVSKTENEINQIKNIDNKNETHQKKLEELDKKLKRDKERIKKINSYANILYKTIINSKILKDEEKDEILHENLNNLLLSDNKKEFENGKKELHQSFNKTKTEERNKVNNSIQESVTLSTLLKLCDEVIESLEETLKKAKELNKEIENKIIKVANCNLNESKNEKIQQKEKKNDKITDELASLVKRRKI